MADNRDRGSPISRLLRAGSSSVVAAILTSAVIGVGTVALTARNADEVIGEIAPLRTDNALLLRNLIDAETSLRGFQLTGADDLLEPYRKAEQAIPDLLSEMRALAGGRAGFQTHIDEVDGIIDEWFRMHAADVITAVVAGPADQVGDALVEEGRAIVDRARTANTAFDADLLAERERLRSRLNTTAAASAALLVLSLTVALTALRWRGRRIHRSVTQPIQQLEAGVARLRTGEELLHTEPSGTLEVDNLALAIEALSRRTAELAESNADRLLEERLVRHLTRRVRDALGSDDVLTRAAEVLGSAAAADRVSVLSVHDSKPEEVLVEWARAGRERLGVGRRIPDQPDLLAALEAIIRGRVTVVVDDVDTDPHLDPALRSLLQRVQARAVVLAPVVAGDEALAMIAMLTTSPTGPWSPLAATAASAVADDLATALTHSRLYDREREMVDRLRALDQAKTDFVSAVSHELRTPLTSIRGYVELLRDGEAGDLNPEQDHMVGIVERNSERLLALIEDLLTLSRVESGAFRTTMRSLELDGLMQSVVDALGPQATARGVTVELDIAEQLPPVTGDRTQLERVLLNLLSNAIKFSDGGGVVTVTARTHDGVTSRSSTVGSASPKRSRASCSPGSSGRAPLRSSPSPAPGWGS